MYSELAFLLSNNFRHLSILWHLLAFWACYSLPNLLDERSHKAIMSDTPKKKLFKAAPDKAASVSRAPPSLTSPASLPVG